MMVRILSVAALTVVALTVGEPQQGAQSGCEGGQAAAPAPPAPPPVASIKEPAR
jgi:hypothetical protein